MTLYKLYGTVMTSMVSYQKGLDKNISPSNVIAIQVVLVQPLLLHESHAPWDIMGHHGAIPGVERKGGGEYPVHSSNQLFFFCVIQ